jgi:hypothetical protein
MSATPPSPRCSRCLSPRSGGFGLPAAIRSDNGPPFASVGLGGLSRLDVWWIRLGIRPERIQPGHPEQNERHGRLHRTLKQATAHPPCRTWRVRQRALEQFRQDYHHERPYQAVALQIPAHCYRRSPRAFPRRLPEVEYPTGSEVHRVRSTGEIKWRGRLVFLSEALIGEPVGGSWKLRPISGVSSLDRSRWRSTTRPRSNSSGSSPPFEVPHFGLPGSPRPFYACISQWTPW